MTRQSSTSGGRRWVQAGARAMRMSAGLILMGTGLITTACGPSSTLDGSINGTEFGEVQSAFFMTSDESLHELQLVLTNYGDGCSTYDSYFRQDATPAGSGPFHAFFVRLQLIDPVGETAYDILQNSQLYPNGIEYAHAWYRLYEAEGWTPASDASAQSGTLVINALSADSLSATLDLSLITGDVLSGSIEAEFCDIADF